MSAFTLIGKGYYLWKVWTVYNGDPVAIAEKAQAMGFTHILIKIANGVYAYNKTPHEFVTPLVNELHKRGIQAWGWPYVFGEQPISEATIAIARVRETGIDGLVIDAEGDYKSKVKAAAAYMDALRKALPTFPIALSSFRYPALHMEFPWREFLSKCDANMPQVYWEKAHNPAWQLVESQRQFMMLYGKLGISPRPYFPTGAAYRWDGWEPTERDVQEFLETAWRLNLPGVNFWEWWCTTARVPMLWEIVKRYQWGTPTPPPPLPDTWAGDVTRGLRALGQNVRDPE